MCTGSISFEEFGYNAELRIADRFAYFNGSGEQFVLLKSETILIENWIAFQAITIKSHDRLFRMRFSPGISSAVLSDIDLRSVTFARRNFCGFISAPVCFSLDRTCVRVFKEETNLGITVKCLSPFHCAFRSKGPIFQREERHRMKRGREISKRAPADSK
jgi:hypothetical protein